MNLDLLQIKFDHMVGKIRGSWMRLGNDDVVFGKHVTNYTHEREEIEKRFKAMEKSSGYDW